MKKKCCVFLVFLCIFLCCCQAVFNGNLRQYCRCYPLPDLPGSGLRALSLRHSQLYCRGRSQKLCFHSPNRSFCRCGRSCAPLRLSFDGRPFNLVQRNNGHNRCGLFPASGLLRYGRIYSAFQEKKQKRQIKSAFLNILPAIYTPYSSLLPSMARRRVTSSAYSRCPPTGTP